MPFEYIFYVLIFFHSHFIFVIISSVRFTLCGVGGIILLSGFVFLTCIDQDVARHNFGNSEGMV
jgi:cationic amino acid transporter 1